MEALFWILLLPVAWCFAGYPLAMLLRARLRPLPPPRETVEVEDGASVVLAVRDAATLLPGRVEDLLAQEGVREILVACNGCADGTEAVAAELAAREPRVRVLVSPAAEGKAGAVNRGVAAASGEVVVFADARQRFAPGAVRALLSAFRDPAVGVASGRLVVRAAEGAVEGVRLYWGAESGLRMAESRTGSVVGATGAIYAVRRSRYWPIPPGTILDDVLVPMRIARGGERVVVAPEAVAYDLPAAGPRAEYRRRRRTAAGNLQLLRSDPWLLSPRANPLLLRYLPHKLLRLAAPLCLAAATAAAAALPGAGYRAFFLGMAAVYLYGAAGLAVRLPLSSIPAAFVMMHGAVLAALLRVREDAATLWIPSAGPVRP